MISTTTAYTIVASFTAVNTFYAATLNFIGHRSVVEVADRIEISTSMMIPFGILLAAGGTGLLVGFAVPALGIAAAGALVLYFVCAIGAHLRAGDRKIGGAAFFLTMATATLVLGLAD